MSETRTRECDCPPWVIRCAHFGDRRVYMREPKDALCEHVIVVGPLTTFAVAVIRGSFGHCHVCGVYGPVYADQRLGRSMHATLPDAEAAFDAAVERLLSEAPL